jgi:hypothetical protein
LINSTSPDDERIDLRAASILMLRELTPVARDQVRELLGGDAGFAMIVNST